MPIQNCPIYSFRDNDTTVVLPIKIINPQSGKTTKTYGLIDTGATECAIPAAFAILLGHSLNEGKITNISTGNGIAQAYGHTSTIEIFHPEYPDNEPIYSIDNVLIDFMPNLKVPLLGVNGFLSNFKLEIDYPNGLFSLLK